MRRTYLAQVDIANFKGITVASASGLASARRNNDFVRSARMTAGSDGAEATGAGIFHSFLAEMSDADADASWWRCPWRCPWPCPWPRRIPRRSVPTRDVAPAAQLAGAEADAVRAPTHPPCPVAVPKPPCG